MEAEKEEGYLSALFREPNAEKIKDLAEKLGKRYESLSRLQKRDYIEFIFNFLNFFRSTIFEKVSVDTTALVLLTGHYMSCVFKGKLSIIIFD